MNRDDIIRMAREAHRELVTKDYPGHAGQLDPWTMQLLERFAALVAAQEREECARVCDAKVKDEYATGLIDHHEIGWTESCAFAIRARGKA